MKKELKVCDECKSSYFRDSSAMMSLCPECSYLLYGYPNCTHKFTDAIVFEGINKLPKKCKEALLLSIKEGLTNMEIADYLKVSVKTVEGHITKAYKILRENLASGFKN